MGLNAGFFGPTGTGGLYLREGIELEPETWFHRVLEYVGGKDIDFDEDLVERYGLRVPVVAHPECGRELTYPFTREELLRFAASVAG